MTRHSPRTVLRRTAGGFAAAGLLAAGSLTMGAQAQAAGPGFTLGGPAETALHPYPADGSPQKSSVAITVNNPSQGEEEGGYGGEVTVTLDLSGIQGVADVSFGEDAGADCEITGSTAVCHDFGIPQGLSGLVQLDVSAAKGSKDGASGAIRATAEADGATFVPFTTRVSVGGPDLVMKRLPFDTDLEPGDTQPAPITFTNKGTTAADGVLLTLMYSRGLDIPERYANCDYTEGTGSQHNAAYSTALCSVDGSFEAGATYTLGVPLSVRATERAYYDTFIYRIHEDGAGQRTAQRAGAPFARGSGPALTLRKLPARTTAPGRDLNPRDNQQEADFRTKNTADFVAYGGEGTAAVGDTVAARVGFRNEGPAWIGNLRSGEAVATVDFTVPKGASVTEKPESCRAVTADGDYREEQLGAPRYLCETSMTVRDGADIALPFALKITELVPGASGAVTVRSTRPSHPELPFDPKPANNTAQLVLNDDSGSEDSGGTSEGTTGTIGSTTGSTTGFTDGATAGDTTGTTSGTSGASGTSGTTGSTSTSGTTGASGNLTAQGGGLAATGSNALLAAGAAATALTAGGVLYATTRRRTRQG